MNEKSIVGKTFKGLKRFAMGAVIYVLLMTVLWLFFSFQVFATNRGIDQYFESRPDMAGTKYYPYHKYVPLKRFYNWPVDMAKDMRSQR